MHGTIAGSAIRNRWAQYNGLRGAVVHEVQERLTRVLKPTEGFGWKFSDGHRFAGGGDHLIFHVVGSKAGAPGDRVAA